MPGSRGVARTGCPGALAAIPLPMHVAVDAQNLVADRRGIGVYLRAVLPRIIASEACEVTLLVRGLPILKRRALQRELGCENFSLANRVPPDADVVWHPWNGTFFESGTPSVVTIHDVAPFAMPENDPATRSNQQAPFLRSARTARRIIADSVFSKSEIIRHLGVEPQKIDVIPLAADARYAPGRPESPLPAELVAHPYILYVGAVEPRKNVGPLVAAWKVAFRPEDLGLLFVTSDDVPPGVIARTALSTEALRDLYRGALFAAVPSSYEGFGLPALEAMACGAPVVCSRVASLPEVCGDAALYVEDPHDVGDWTAALRELFENAPMRARLRELGFVRAAQFSWDSTAEQTLRVLQGVIAR